MLAIVDLIVVGCWIRILMPGKRILLPQETEDGRNIVKDVWLNQRSTVTAIVFSVVDKQRWTWRPQRRQHRIVTLGEHVWSVMFQVARIPRALDSRGGSGEARYRHCHTNPFIQRAQKHGLESASRQARHA